MSIAIIDYGVGNIRSIQNAFTRINLPKPILSSERDTLANASGLILPGVGAFSACSQKLVDCELGNFLTDLVVEKKKPILGICVGMQLMADSSTEGGVHKGLGWIPGHVVKFPESVNYYIPHVGWNNCDVLEESPLFELLNSGENFYFDHSYHFTCAEEFVIATANHGRRFTAAIQIENIFGVQFHPEKSAKAGLRIFRGFNNYVTSC